MHGYAHGHDRVYVLPHENEYAFLHEYVHVLQHIHAHDDVRGREYDRVLLHDDYAHGGDVLLSLLRYH